MKFTTPVIKGHGRGKTLGFPTFNLQIPADLQHKHGIYAGFVWIDKQKYPGAFHFGPIPVFSDSSPHLEVFVLDYGVARSATESAKATGSRNGRIGSLREAAVASEDNSDQQVSEVTFELLHYLR